MPKRLCPRGYALEALLGSQAVGGSGRLSAACSTRSVPLALQAAHECTPPSSTGCPSALYRDTLALQAAQEALAQRLNDLTDDEIRATPKALVTQATHHGPMVS